MGSNYRGFLAIFALVFIFTFAACSASTGTDAIHSISLSHTEHVFDSAAVGYGTQDSVTVTVSNTGNQATGTLSITTSADSFTLSRTSLDSISAGGVATFTVRPSSGLDVGTHTATVTVLGSNGIMAQVNKKFTVTAAVITPIDSLDIHITAPTKGETPASAITVTSTLPFSAGAVTWSPDDNPFQGEVVYTATVTLTAKSGYTFAGLYDARINGQSAVVGPNGDTNVTLSRTFQRTLDKEVTKIAIKTQPNNLNYTHGDELDLTGLEITLTYDDTTTENVASAYFFDKGISTIPASGDTLSRSAHNGTAVKVEQGHFTVNTNNLTVNKANGAAVSGAPTVNGTPTVNSITINAVSNTSGNGQIVQYAISTLSGTTPINGWQTGTTFTSLTSGTSYYVYARTAENDNYLAGESSGSVGITTLSQGNFTITFEQIANNTPVIGSGSITITIYQNPVGGSQSRTATLTVTNQDDYTSIEWYYGGTLLNTTPTKQASLTLDAADVRYNEVGTHNLTLWVVKDGKVYSRTISFTVN